MARSALAMKRDAADAALAEALAMRATRQGVALLRLLCAKGDGKY